MDYVLYLDVLFLVNWMLDVALLGITGSFLRRRIYLGRVGLAAAAGAVWVCLYTIFSWNEVIVRWVGLIPMAFLLVIIAYPSRKGRELFRGWCCLYLSAVLVGGMIHMVYDNAVFRVWRMWMLRSSWGGISIWLLAGSMVTAMTAIHMGSWYRRSSVNRERIREVTLYYGQRKITVQGLWDSGNQLQDPYSGQMVHMLQKEQALLLLGEEMDQVPFHLVPCRSLGSEHSLIPVITVSKLQLAQGPVWQDARVGISPRPLSNDGTYQMLLHAQTDEVRRISYDH